MHHSGVTEPDRRPLKPSGGGTGEAVLGDQAVDSDQRPALASLGCLKIVWLQARNLAI
jgi:hypothetical protein